MVSDDCCVSTFCKLCALVQEQQEVEDIKNDMIAQIASARGTIVDIIVKTASWQLSKTQLYLF